LRKEGISGVKAEGIGGEREGDFMDNFNGNHQFFECFFKEPELMVL
jgi:hypothetical protein